MGEETMVILSDQLKGINKKIQLLEQSIHTLQITFSGILDQFTQTNRKFAAPTPVSENWRRKIEKKEIIQVAIHIIEAAGPIGLDDLYSRLLQNYHNMFPQQIVDEKNYLKRLLIQAAKNNIIKIIVVHRRTLFSL